MAKGKTTVFEPNIGTTIARIARPAKISGAAEARIMRQVRGELDGILKKVVVEAFTLPGGFGIQTKSAFNSMRYTGVRVFGTTFNTLRGHILGPYYIRRMEEGGTIEPRNAMALAIPMPAALRPDGTPKLPGPRSWLNIKKTFIWVKKSTGRAFIVYKNPKGSQYAMTFLYVLVEEAEVRQNPALGRAWDRNKGDLIQTLGRAMTLEFGTTDYLSLAKLTYKGRKK
jgi:hypothetical protein